MFTWFSKINTFKGSKGDNTDGPDYRFASATLYLCFGGRRG